MTAAIARNTRRYGVFGLALMAVLGCNRSPNPGPGESTDSPGESQTTPQTTTPSGLTEAADPGMPAFPETIGTLTVTVSTLDESTAGTNDPVSVCLNANDCWSLDIADVDDLEPGETGVKQITVDLPRSAVDRVELRMTDGGNQWRPECLSIRFDGEPMYCHRFSGEKFGNSGDEVLTWSDPQGLHEDCQQCSPGPITVGPLLGHSSPATASVWVRSDATRAVALRVSPTTDIAAGVVVDWAYPSPEDDFSAHLNVTGLQPGAEYTYAIEVDGTAIGAPRTLRAAPMGAAPLKLAFGSCAKDDPQAIFDTIATHNPDLFAFIGDNHYANSSDLDSIRWHYRNARLHSARAAFVDDMPVLATWDDHDFVGNNTDGFEPGRDNALRAFNEYWANPSAGTTDTKGVFFQSSWGDEIDLFFVDDRYWRGWDDTLLGEGQTAWLKDALRQSDATYKLMFCGSQWTSEGSSDSWADFDDARNDLFDFLRDEQVEGVVLLSGDIHRSSFRILSHPGLYDIPELTSSPLAHSNSPCLFGDDERLACLDQGNSFLVVDFEPSGTEAGLHAVIYREDGSEFTSVDIPLSSLKMP